MNELERTTKRLRNLPQYKNYTQEELNKIAQEKIERDNLLSSLTFCLPEEKEYATKLLEGYLNESSFENFSERDTLSQLIGLEILAERIKKYLATEYGKANPCIPVQMVQQLNDLNTQILNLKEKLGLVRKENQESELKEVLESLKRKALKYFEEHQGCNVVKCPHCQNLFYLLLKTEHLTSEKCKWFRNTILYNKDLFDLYHNKRITKTELANILGVAELYIDKLYDNLYLKEKSENDR